MPNERALDDLGFFFRLNVIVVIFIFISRLPVCQVLAEMVVLVTQITKMKIINAFAHSTILLERTVKIVSNISYVISGTLLLLP